MSIGRTQARLELPGSLRGQLRDYRGRLWAIRLAEALASAVFGLTGSSVLMFGLDRIWETPAWPRFALFLLAAISCALIPLALHRWVWRRRTPDQLALLISRTLPTLGDQLLGIIELVRNESEQARSPALCEAAVRQVADDVSRRDLRLAVPRPRHRSLASLAAIPLTIALALLAIWPAAASNAWARLAFPWKDVDRYTFASVEPLPDRLIVPHGEPSSLAIRLSEKGQWQPSQAEARVGSLDPVVAPLIDGGYDFELPPLLDSRSLVVYVGDSVIRSTVEPMLRPELSEIVAQVTLPEYLERPGTSNVDARGGTLSLVNGSTAQISATAGRELANATIDGQPAESSGRSIRAPQLLIDGPGSIEFSWTDQHGLSGKAPFVLAIDGRNDEEPSVTCEGLPQRKVVLDSEQLAFTVRARDDFGIKRIGLEWQGADRSASEAPDRGERILSAGGSDQELVEVDGVFSARSLGITPQPIVVRIFAEDYFPDRPRSYSPSYTLYVLSPEQHAIWLTEQLSKWQRRSLEVRDRELQLLNTNKELRDLPAEDLDAPATRRRIEAQAAAENANGRRLSGLANEGEELLRQAMRNPEFGVGHLESLAEMLQVLKDIADNRMPSVADLLAEAAEAPSSGSQKPKESGPMAGQNRSSASGSGADEQDEGDPPPTAPQLTDIESSQQPPGEAPESESPPKKPSAPRLGLPTTTLMGQPGDDPPPPPPPAGEKLDEAIQAQEDLLAEFEKIAGELNELLGNLEGSTLVKRLKAASRHQYEIAGLIIDQLDAAFGQSGTALASPSAETLDQAAEQERESSFTVSTIMDDMQSYFERRRLVRLNEVLEEMREEDVVGNLRQLGDELKSSTGLSVAQCEYWSDSLDRWAEDLVDPACSGTCPGGKSRSSLPPSIVLEVLQILEGEINLREETRVADQARPALNADDHAGRAGSLAETQDSIAGRVDAVIDRIRDLPDGDSEFAPEIQLLGAVFNVMDEAAAILRQPETGGPAIAAETEAIELLLQSRRINPNGGGGGGGATPGGGGGGETNDSALALVGRGDNEKEVREDRVVTQTTGDTGRSLPEEFRAGLDTYFERLEDDGS